MYDLAQTIPNCGTPSLINEVCFAPDGQIFAASYERSNEVRIYDTRTCSLINTLSNPVAGLNYPHGILLTSRHLIVANKRDRPGTLSVFALEDSSGVPVQYFTTPFAHLAEGHSIALHGRRLVVSYCEGRGKKGALVCYDFDDQAGQIGTVLDMTEHWFSNYGDAKGVSFDPTGSRVYVTFQSNWWSLRSVVKQRLMHFLSFGARGHPSRNGIALFGIDAEGRFTKKPLWKTLKGGPRRLENIHVLADSAVVTDPATGNVTIYDLRLDKSFSKPVQVIQNDLAFPHGAKFSPDGTLLLVADNGLEKIDHLPQWFSFTSPRKDRLLIYQRQSA